MLLLQGHQRLRELVQRLLLLLLLSCCSPLTISIVSAAK
jgi:hypothetical protein